MNYKSSKMKINILR